MIRSCTIALVLVLTSMAADIPAPAPAPKPLAVSDRLQIREIQLGLAQAHIARLQAEAQVRTYEAQLGKVIEDLKVQYSCRDCTLQADFTWTKPEPVKAPVPATPTPAPQKDGPNPKKE